MLLLKPIILWEWVRIFVPAPTRNFFYWACHIVAAVNIAFYSAALISTHLACQPYRRNWDKTIPGTCIDIKIINLSTAIINFILDIAILILPQKIIWGLQMSTQRKFGMSIIFAIGIMYANSTSSTRGVIFADKNGLGPA
jgi:hypothetical protein